MSKERRKTPFLRATERVLRAGQVDWVGAIAKIKVDDEDDEDED